MIKVVWKPTHIAGYEASSAGRIRSVGMNLILSNRPDDGYYVTRLSVNGLKKNYKTHRLIAKAFIPNPENKPQVNHIDGNKTNNHINNLEWCTAHENMQHAINIGIASSIKNSKPVLQILPCGNTVRFKSMTAAIKAMGLVGTNSIYVCCHDETKTAGGFKWRFSKV